MLSNKALEVNMILQQPTQSHLCFFFLWTYLCAFFNGITEISPLENYMILHLMTVSKFYFYSTF